MKSNSYLDKLHFKKWKTWSPLNEAQAHSFCSVKGMTVFDFTWTGH